LRTLGEVLLSEEKRPDKDRDEDDGHGEFMAFRCIGEDGRESEEYGGGV
jgi:hypothetical protein